MSTCVVWRQYDMTLGAATEGRPAQAFRQSSTVTFAVLLFVACVAVGHAAVSPSLSRLTLAISVAFCFVALVTIGPRFAVYGLITWLLTLGLTRRLLTQIGVGPPKFGDPMLLIGPALMLVLFLFALQRDPVQRRTPLSKVVLALTLALGLSTFNPLQGNISVGLGGMLLVVVPMLGFWIGRTLLDDRAMGTLITLLAVLAVPLAIYGLIQTLVGMPSWDQTWIRDSGYAALHVGTTIRPFASSTSASEYATLLGVGALSWCAIARSPRRLLAAAPVLSLLLTALWLESSRGIVVLTLAAMWMIFAATHKISLARALTLGAMLLLLLPTVVGHLAPAKSQAGSIGSLTSHQSEGLSAPLGPNSTLGIHAEEVADGLTQSIANPLGRGIGATTIAANKYGGAVAATEADPGNAPVAAGVIGLVLYLLVARHGLASGFRLAQRERTVVAVAALGILVVSFLQWLNGGQYTVMALVWIVLGWIDSAYHSADNHDRPAT